MFVMKNLHAITEKIVEFRWQNEYDKALDLFRNQVHHKYKVPQIKESARLITAVLDCLKETNRLTQALEFVEKYLQVEVCDPLVCSIRKTLGWVFFLYVNPKSDPQITLSPYNLSLVRSVLAHLQAQNDNKLFELLLLRLIDFLCNRAEPAWDIAIELFSVYAPESLSEEAEKIVTKINGKDKQLEMASSREKGYVMYSKALFATSQYSACIKVCQRALEQIREFHYGNHHWLTRRIALCYQNLGQLQKAIHTFEMLLRKRNEWFIQKELAELYLQAKELEQALNVGQSACANGGLSPYKTGLFVLMGKISESLGDVARANEYYVLGITIRKEQGWKIPKEIQHINSPEDTPNSHEQYKRLKVLWPSKVNKELVRQEVLHTEGTITRILHPGENGDGFITTSTGIGIYFRFSQARIPYGRLTAGLRVGVKAKQISRNGKMVYNATQVFDLA
jgi:tetratricopeptide (TPR) repeat protein